MFIALALVDGPIRNISENYRELSRMLVCGDELASAFQVNFHKLVVDTQTETLLKLSSARDQLTAAVEVSRGVNIRKTIVQVTQGELGLWYFSNKPFR